MVPYNMYLISREGGLASRRVEQNGKDWPHKVTDRFACFESTLSKTLQEEIGQDVFNKELDNCCRRWSFRKRLISKA
jgi:hypothetical protein